MLKAAQLKLADLLVENEADVDIYAQIAQNVEAIIKLANADEFYLESSNVVSRPDSGTGSEMTTHPLLAKLTISVVDLSALEHFNDGI